MPAFELDINPVRNGQYFAQGTQLRSGSEVGRYEVPDDPSIEGVTGHAQPCIPHNVAGHAASSANARANVKKREVAGASAQISDQNKFVVVEGGFIVVSRRDRLHFELHRFKASQLQRRSQPRLSVAVIFVVLGSHKMNRSAHDRGSNVGGKLKLGLFPQIAKNPGDEIFERIAPSENFGTVKVPATQKGLQRLNQSTLGLGGKILLNALGAGPGLKLLDSIFFPLLKV